MKKTLVAILAVALVMTMLCAQALAVCGDITVKSVKAYTDSSLKTSAGKIPAYTAVVVGAYGTYACVYAGGKQPVYVKASALLRKDAPTKYTATLKKGTTVYQRADKDANSYTLKKGGTVKICMVKNDWALVQTTGKVGLYAFVKVSKLNNLNIN